jgi:protein disulfide-isomerase A6
MEAGVCTDYNGARTAKALSDAVAERIPNHVTKLSGSKFTEFLSDKNETAKAILFTNKGTTSALWRSLAVDFLDAISFAQVRDKETAAVESMGVTKFPTIVVLPGGDAGGKVYGGKMEKQAIYDFFAAVKVPKSKDEPQSSSSSSASTTKPSSTRKSTSLKTSLPRS